ncbi:hypothetical protein V2J09_021165 [Rumex salicifolius]
MSAGLSLVGFLSFPRARTPQFQNPYFRRIHFSGLSNSRTLSPVTLTVAKFGLLDPGQLPDPDSSDGFISELLGRAEGFFYPIADAAVSNSDAYTASTTPTDDWLSGITSYMEIVLKVLNDGLSQMQVPYAYGFSIILLTVIVKAATFPLTKKQVPLADPGITPSGGEKCRQPYVGPPLVESTMAMRSLQPQIKVIQERYAGDQERSQLEIARIYKLARINPLAGCLPTIATIPIWIGLYRALSNVANEGLLTEGFYWIPSLAGPTTIAARQNGSGISWLFPFVDGHPPLGWSATLAYLVLPALLVVSQYVSVQIMQSSQPNDPNSKTSQTITKFLPLLVGLTNNILSTAQQVWLQKLGGAKNPIANISVETFKDEKPESEEKKALEMKSANEIEGEEASLSPPMGPRPGERFKQLKEEEARRRRQTEEEEMRRKAAAANVVTTNDYDDEADKAGNGHPVNEGDDTALYTNHISSSSNPTHAATNNGSAAFVASGEQENNSIPVEET